MDSQISVLSIYIYIHFCLSVYWQLWIHISTFNSRVTQQGSFSQSPSPRPSQTVRNLASLRSVHLLPGSVPPVYHQVPTTATTSSFHSFHWCFPSLCCVLLPTHVGANLFWRSFSYVSGKVLFGFVLFLVGVSDLVLSIYTVLGCVHLYFCVYFACSSEHSLADTRQF